MKERNKNTPKYNAYRMAFSMIKCALQRDCPLQAIAVEESVLTDRLSSTLNFGRTHAQPKDTLGRVLSEWHPKRLTTTRNANADLFDEEMELLFPKLSAWWGKRNELMHGIAKSAQGEAPNISADDFMDKSRCAAKEGYALVRKVDTWTRKQVRSAEKQQMHKENSMKNQMKHKIVKCFVALALCAGALGVLAAEQTQVANGVKWSYLVSNGKAIITSDSKWVTPPRSPVAIKIPQTLGGCTVDKIRKYALSNLKSEYVRQLIIPDGVTYIEGDLGIGTDNVGANYSRITSLTLPKTLKYVGPEAFDGLFRGTQLVLPEGLEVIKSGAFANCDKLTSITVPSSVKEIGKGAFSGCPIKNATINTKIFSTELSRISNQKSVVVPEGITEIKKYQFYKLKISSITLPKGLKSIEDCAFEEIAQGFCL